MKQETYNKTKEDSLYKHSAIPFINSLINLSVPLSAIDTNDWHNNTMPRVYVTREHGRKNGGQSRKAHLNQFGFKAAKRLANFYHTLSDSGIRTACIPNTSCLIFWVISICFTYW